MTRHCEVCGSKLSPNQKYFCSSRCKAIAQTKEWQIIQDLRKTGRISFIQLVVILQKRYGKRNVDEHLSNIMKLLKRTTGVEIKIR